MSWYDEKAGCWIASFGSGVDRQQVRYSTKGKADKRERDEHIKRERLAAALQSPTFERAAETYLQVCEQTLKAEATIHAFRSDLRCHVLPKIGDIRVGLLDEAILGRLRDEIYGTLNRNHARRSFGVVRAVLDEAMTSGVITENVANQLPYRRSSPSRNSNAPGKGRRQRILPTKTQLKFLLSTSSGALQVAYHIAVLAGLRRSELVGLRWSDIADGYLFVKRQAPKKAKHATTAHRKRRNTKTKSPPGRRKIPISAPLKRILDAWRAKCPPEQIYVLTQEDGTRFTVDKLVAASVSFQIGEGLVRSIASTRPSGRKGWLFPFHMLRHACIALWLEAKVRGDDIARWAGHARFDFTASTYGYVFPSDDTDDAHALAA